jgi:taurine dioxygenase
MADQGHPEIVVLESDAKRPYVADRWHSDVSFEKCPPLGSILRAVAVPETGGDTMWANMYAAHDALSDTMQRLLSGLTAFHDGGGFARIAKDDSQRRDLESRQTAEHPVVRTHPATGRRALFVNSVFTKRIVGMKPAESRALLGFLCEHLASPDFSCRFRWRKDSIAMWDNRCTQHRVVADAVPSYRRMERVTLIGDEPR